MRIIHSLRFRVLRTLGLLPTGRSDVLSPASMRRWIRRQDQCVIESDLQIRGASDVLTNILLGSRVAIDKGCILWLAVEDNALPMITMGSRVYLGPYSYLGSYAPLSIGENTIIGAHSYIITANHRFLPDLPIQDQGYDAAPITIGRDVWIGCHVVILPGVTIGDGAIIGAGAVVNKNIPPAEKWAGVPARKLGVRS